MPIIAATGEVLGGLAGGLILGALGVGIAFWLYRQKQTLALDLQRQQLEQAHSMKLEEARAKLEIAAERTEMQREQAHQARLQQLEQREAEATERLQRVEADQAALKQQREAVEQQLRELSAQDTQLSQSQLEYRERLQSLAEMNREQAREVLRAEVARDCAEEARLLKHELLEKSEREVQHDARRVLVTAMQRLSSRPQHDVTATMVSLPNDEMKGRIIGREGRNIKSFESVTGTTLLIDETPNTVLISSFDPLRRETARLALEALVRDGRIHPSSIEEAVAKAEEEVKQSVTEFGENALRQLRLGRMHPEVIAALGRMHFRLSNNQNSLDHSIEVANLSALMAAEIGLDTEVAKRCGLLHDIGKVLDENYPGSHATAGANFLKRFGESDERVTNAVACHHLEVEPTSAYGPLLMCADSLSAMRPGARAESIDSYIQRVRNLEKIVADFDGVQETYALQAGREIRVIVQPEQIDDAEARLLARNIRRRIEEELQYPGTIKVTVIRETRVSETAK